MVAASVIVAFVIGKPDRPLNVEIPMVVPMLAALADDELT